MLPINHMAPWVPTFICALQAEVQNFSQDKIFYPFLFSTIDNKKMIPHVRTLMCRGFLFGEKTNNVLTTTTDKRTPKYQQLLNNDNFEALFYFSKIKKQFRMSGKAKLLDDQHFPIIDLSTFNSKFFLEKKKKISINEDEVKSDDEIFISEDENDNEIKTSKINHHNITDKNIMNHNYNSNNFLTSQFDPINYFIVSKDLMNKLNQALNEKSYLDLNDLVKLDFQPPTKGEWDAEKKRLWSHLSKGLKKSFQRPPPLTQLSEENLKLIDSILRGVDGKKDDDGFKNFSVILLFIDKVDLIEFKENKRYIYEKDIYEQWSEKEVCL